MINLHFAHICDHAFLSQDGKLNVIGILKNIKIQKLPFVYPKITCVVNFSIEPHNHHIKIQILKKESHEVIAKVEGPITPPPHNNKPEMEVGFISDFNTVKFEEPGWYKIEVWIDEHLITTLPFSVEFPQ